MNHFPGFTQDDFNVFTISGLEQRMEALKSNVSPKLEIAAQELAPYITSITGDEMFVHVAKHARRTTNPPNDTWAALANSKKGYKKLPHFQIGLWESHVFIWFAVIYESPIKQDFAKVLKQNLKQVREHIPADYVWSKDHTKPEAIPNKDLSDREFENLVDRLQNVKKAELLCGVHIDRHDVVLQDHDAFIKKCEETFHKLEYLYRLTKEVE
ncbi:YktB family protein [Pontibacillus yanchengensis]|uniref:UPF0637 protein N782_13115 n=1 Tax=Pontibacillus yanchengensis Y32 TaxID=1385514 RepID=A0A0A2T8Z6_9BACI|nr:DUF1054 domain-containing protein [Pontibacillus yanchengensis]KGP72282.1 hypothetical protein N782_13115 [Pontibacillus yanchengensis Y32]